MAGTMKLERTHGNRWRSRSAEHGIEFSVSGTADAPDPGLEATARDLFVRWPVVRAALEAFAAALPGDASIPLQPPLNGAFAARDCGFDGPLRYVVIGVTDPAAPSHATVTFYTGLPDGYVTFEAKLVSGVPVTIEAFAS